MERVSLNIQPDISSLSHTAAESLLVLVQQAANEGRRFKIALAGGSTPRSLYTQLARPDYIDRMPWNSVDFFFGDERSVGPEHEESNYRMAHEALLSHLPVGEDQIFRIEGEAGDIRASAQRYHDILDNQLSKDASGIPQFDLVLLGLGPDGHIASLFPDTDALDVTDRYAVAVWVEKFNTWRISITFPLINHARHVWLFVSGGGKADIVADIFAAGHTTRRYPVQLIDAQGDICWYLDHAAAAKLP